MRLRCDNNKQGFTLVEISVVMVIIGLLAAGILVGSSIMKSAELQKVASNFIKFRDATKQFHDKYKYFPGDFPEAASFWELADVCGGDPTDPVKATCDGNGDGVVGGAVGNPLQFGTEFREPLYFWQHLTNAGFLEGAYTGRGATVGSDWWDPGVNLPIGMDENSAYTFSYSAHGTTAYGIVYPEIGNVNNYTFELNYGHVIVYGNPRHIGNRRTASGMALSGAEAMSLDQKIDDGKPGLGNVVAIPKTQDGITYMCVDSTNSTSAVYVASSDTKMCSLIFMTGL
jgi:prepilin-type N-terminal cleavage/methylation domain-containing protein